MDVDFRLTANLKQGERPGDIPWCLRPASRGTGVGEGCRDEVRGGVSGELRRHARQRPGQDNGGEARRMRRRGPALHLRTCPRRFPPDDPTRPPAAGDGEHRPPRSTPPRRFRPGLEPARGHSQETQNAPNSGNLGTLLMSIAISVQEHVGFSAFLLTGEPSLETISPRFSASGLCCRSTQDGMADAAGRNLLGRSCLPVWRAGLLAIAVNLP